MSDDPGPDSDSSGRESRRSVMWPRCRRLKEARICYSSRTTMSLQDPMPEYVDPELVKLIAQNAPFELDVFMDSLRKSSTKRRAESGGRCEGAAKHGKPRPPAVEALLSSVRERNHHLSERNDGQDTRHSCPEQIWRAYDEPNEKICRATAVKRKRPKSADTSRPLPSDRKRSSAGSFRISDNDCRDELRRTSLESVSANSSNEGLNCMEGECFPLVKADAFDDSSAPARLPSGNDCDMLSAKPWRHGMRKNQRSAKDERPPNASCCKRKAETDPRKASEVRKYMEIKMVERRKEQQQMKAEADAALATRKEQQRKLALHRQAMFQSQMAFAKSRENSPRPEWVSECGSPCEPPRPWSSSSGELNTYLPPPATPPNLEPIPLDLYATQLQYAEVRSSTPRVYRLQVQNAQVREKRRSKQLRGCSREVQRQLKYAGSEAINEFPHTSSVARKGRLKAKTKLRGRKFSSEEVGRQLFERDEPCPQRRSGDSDVHNRSLKRQMYSNGGSPFTASKESQAQKLTPKFPTKSCNKPRRPAESSAKSVTKGTSRPVTNVKRLKATQQHFIPSKPKELTGEDLATFLNSNRATSDCETNVKLNGQVLPERRIVGLSQVSPASEQESIIDLRKCVEHSFGSPQKNSTDEDVLGKWFGPSVACSEHRATDEDVQHENTCQMVCNNEVQFQVDYQKKKSGDNDVPGDIPRATTKNPTLAVRWQRMQLLKKLAEQLVKRVDEACAKKRQIEHSAAKQITAPSKAIHTEPSEQLPMDESGHVDSLERESKQDHQPTLNNGLPSIHLAASLIGEKSRQSEPEIFHQSKHNNTINYRGLTEQEQAGSETLPMKPDEMKSNIKVTSSKSASTTENCDNNFVGERVSKGCTMMEWNASEKGTDLPCNNTSSYPTFAPSSAATASSSPVVLPTSAKYRMGRIKHSKLLSKEEKTRKRAEDWVIPAENDEHSIFHVYTRYLKDREKSTASTFTPVLQNNLCTSATNGMERDPCPAGPSAQEDLFNDESIPLSRKLAVSELPLKSPGPMTAQTTRFECSNESTESLVSDGIGPDLQKQNSMSSPGVGSFQQRELGEDMPAVLPTPEVTNLKTEAIEEAGLNPELTILEIGDLKVCQSPTSFHLRLERCKDNGEDTNAKDQKFLNIRNVPNVVNCKETSSSTQEAGGQCVRQLIPPMKITYARRVNSRARPNDGCIDDERVVVELQQMNADAPAVSFRGDVKMDSPDGDASERALTGLTFPHLNKALRNPPSEIVETRGVKHSSVNDEDFETYVFSKGKGNGHSEPIVDRGSLDNLKASEGETRSQCTMLTCQESRFDPRIEFRDSEEWELKLRRDQLEAELKKLDAEIMKTRAKLHQHHPLIDSQSHGVSSISLAAHQVEAFKLDNIPNIQERIAKRITPPEKDTDVVEENSDVQKQKIVSTLFTREPIRDGEKAITSSNSFSDSFLSEDTDMGQNIPVTGNCDYFPDHLRSTENVDVNSISSRVRTTGIQRFETALESMHHCSQSSALTKQTKVLSHCKMPSTQEKFANEGSEICTGRGPGRRLDKPPEIDCEESIARCRTSKPTLATDQIAEVNVRGARLSTNDESSGLHDHTKLPDSLHNLVDTEEKSESGRWTLRHSHSIHQPTKKKLIRDEEQKSVQRRGRNSEELLGYGAGQIPRSGVQCGAQNSDNSKDLMAWRENDESAVAPDLEISPRSRTPPCIDQNGWPVNGEDRSSQRNYLKKKAEAKSRSKTQDDYASEVLNMRGPGRTQDKSSEVACDEITAARTTSNVRSVPGQMVEADVRVARLFAKDETTVPQHNTAFSEYDRPDSVHNPVNAEEKSGRGSSIPLHSICQQTEERIIRRDQRQASVLESGRNLQELPECGAIECPSSIVQCEASNSDNNMGLLPRETNERAPVTGSSEIVSSNYTPPFIQQKDWPLTEGESNDATGDLVEVPRSPVDELQDGRISHAGTVGTVLRSARTSEDSSDELSNRELTELSQTIRDGISFTRRTLASFHARTIFSAEDSSSMLPTEELSLPLPPTAETEECVPVGPSFHSGLQTSQTSVELPAQHLVQCNSRLSNEANGQTLANVEGRPSCSHEHQMSDNFATPVPRFIHAVCFTPLNVPCGSSTEEAPWESLSLPSHVDFSTIKDKLSNNKLSTDEHLITDGWSINSQCKSFDSPTSTAGGDSSGGRTLASESVITSNVPHDNKNCPESLSSVEFERAATTNCSPKGDANEENSSLILLSRQESLNMQTHPNSNLPGTKGLLSSISSTRGLPSFLPSLYFHQQTTKTNVSEEVESTISEDLEHYESDVNEELQDDVPGPSSGNLETTYNSLPPSSDLASPIPDLGCCLGDRSPDIQVSPKSGLDIPNGLPSRTDHAYTCSSTDCIDQDLTGQVPESCGASGMASPSTMSPTCPEIPLSLHAAGQNKSLAINCASPKSPGSGGIRRVQRVSAASTEDSTLKDISRISDNFYCDSEVSESHHQSESISEDVPSDDSEMSSNGSGPARENIDSVDGLEFTSRKDINEEVEAQSFGRNGKNVSSSAMACCAHAEPVVMHNVEKQHPHTIGGIITAPRIAKQNPDMIFATDNFLERSINEDNSNLRLASHHEPESSRLVELPKLMVLPPLRALRQPKQHDGTHCSTSLRFGQLSTNEPLRVVEEQLSTKLSGLQLESAFTEGLAGTPAAASPVAISNPELMVKTRNTILRCEQNNPATVCTLDVTSIAGNETPVQKTLDAEGIALSPHQLGPLQVSSTNSLVETLEEVGHRPCEAYTSSAKFLAADLSLGNDMTSVTDELSALATPALSHNITEYSWGGLEKNPHLDGEYLIVSTPLDCASVTAPTITADDILDASSYLTTIGNENQHLCERRMTRIESKKCSYSLNGDKSTGGQPSSAHLMVRADRDILSLPEIDHRDTFRSEEDPLRPDQIIALKFRQSSTISRPSPVVGHQQIVTDFDKDAENEGQDQVSAGNVHLRYSKTILEFEGQSDQLSSNAYSRQGVQTDLPSLHGLISDSICSDNEELLSQSLGHIVGNGIVGAVHKIPITGDLEKRSCESSSSRCPSIYMEEKEEVRRCGILEGEEKLLSCQVNCCEISKERMASTKCLTGQQEASTCPDASQKLDVRVQVEVNREEKLGAMTDFLTNVIYEDLLSVELSGLHQEAKRTSTSPKISDQTQNANVTKTLNPKPKRSRKNSEFCQVLKHFLPIGWRSASIRHKKGLFLHVEGLRPHPLIPTSKPTPGTLKFNVQYPNCRESEHFGKASNTQSLLLDWNEAYACVQGLFELSSLIVNPSPTNWFDSRQPVGEDSLSALDSQLQETGHMFQNSRWQIQKKLILDVINETLLKQFATKLPLPSFGKKTLPLPAGGEHLVQFVTNEIVEHERYASRYGFDIEKVIAKAFENEHWEKCSEEARDVVGDLAQGILCDLIEAFVYEMVRGWRYYINKSHALAS